MAVAAAPAGPRGLPEFADAGGLGVAERRMLDRGKRDHRETTESARRALQVAEQTEEIARSTLVELHRQGQQLQKTDQGMQAMEKDVQEAGRIVRFLRRWCCFQVLCCCDCFDPDSKMDQTRQRRLKQRQMEMEMAAANVEAAQAAKEQAVDRIVRKGLSVDEDEARSELMMTASDRVKLKQAAQRPTALGAGLHEADRIALHQETEKQDQILDRIGTSVENLKIMSMDLHGELSSQNPQIDALADRAHAAHDNLGSLSKAARKI